MSAPEEHLCSSNWILGWESWLMSTLGMPAPEVLDMIIKAALS